MAGEQQKNGPAQQPAPQAQQPQVTAPPPDTIGGVVKVDATKSGGDDLVAVVVPAHHIVYSHGGERIQGPGEALLPRKFAREYGYQIVGEAPAVKVQKPAINAPIAGQVMPFGSVPAPQGVEATTQTADVQTAMTVDAGMAAIKR